MQHYEQVFTDEATDEATDPPSSVGSITTYGERKTIINTSKLLAILIWQAAKNNGRKLFAVVFLALIAGTKLGCHYKQMIQKHFEDNWAKARLMYKR